MINLSRSASLTLAFAGGVALCIAGAVATMLAGANPAFAQAQPQLIISPTELHVGEGESATYTVHFDANPVAFDDVECGDGTKGRVYVNMRGVDFSELEVSPNIPAFKTGNEDCEGGNWDNPRNITVRAVNDDVEKSRQTFTISHAVWDNVGGTPVEDTATPKVRVTVYDNDPAGSWVSIAPGSSSTEGNNVMFTLMRGNDDMTQTRTVNVSLSETGSMISGSRSMSVEFAANSATATLEVETDDDDVDEADSEIRVTLRAPSGYTISGRPWATATVTDNDFARLSISADPPTIEEGQRSTVTVSITNDVTFAANQTIELDFIGSMEVEDTDFRVSPETLTLRAGQSQATATITANNDRDTEEAEEIEISGSHEGRAIGSATITIKASDLRVRMSEVTDTTAKAVVEVVNADGTIHLRYREQGNPWPSQPTAMETVDIGETSVQFDLTSLTDGTTYEVQASLANDFMDDFEPTTFTAGQQPSRPPGNGGGSGGGGGVSRQPEPDPEPEPVIEHFWESPESGATVAGIQLIRGWAFSDVADDPVAVVELHIDGALTADIPCCTARADVAGIHPTFPQALDSGWGLAWNWGVLSAGSHTVQVWYETTGGTRLASTLRTVEVLKPGGFEFLDQFDLSAATAGLAEGAVMLEQVRVRDAASQAEAVITARFGWDPAAQGLALAAATTTEVVSMGQPPDTGTSPRRLR